MAPTLTTRDRAAQVFGPQTTGAAAGGSDQLLWYLNDISSQVMSMRICLMS
jgi:hypothetical protein